MVPYAVIRSNNIPLEYLGQLTSSQNTKVIYYQLKMAKEQLKLAQQNAEQELYEFASNDEQNHKQIIKFKRKISSGKHEDIDHLFNRLECKSALPITANWLSQLEELWSLQAQLAGVLSEAKQASRSFISEVLQHDLFYKSLCFSGLNLARLADKYPGTELIENKKNLNDEETLIKYISRAITKVSPFSGFTSVGFSKITNTQPLPLARSKWVYGTYNIDKSILLKVIRKITTEEVANFNYKITNNVVEKEDGLLFFCFSDNQDSYAFNSQLNELKLKERQWLYDLFQSPWVKGETLLENAKKAGMQEVINHLIEKGLIVADMHINEMSDHFIEEVVELLTPIKSEKVTKFVSYLTQLSDLYQKLESDQDKSIGALIFEFDRVMGQCASLYGIDAVKHSGFVYHNTYTRCEGGLSLPLVTKIEEDLRAFYDSYLSQAVVNYIDTRCLEKIKAYLSETGSCDIFTLFNYTKEYGGLKRQNSFDSNNPIYDLYSMLWTNQGKEEIELPTRKRIGTQPISALSAYGSLVGEQFVLNNIDSGYLRTYSRFFKFAKLPSEIQQCVESYGDDLKKAYDFYDSFGYNTASRPRLAQGRIWLDNRQYGTDGDICLSDIAVRWSEQYDQPELFNQSSGEAIRVRHTSLFIPQLYPKLLEFVIALSTLGEAKYYTMRAGLLMSMVNYSPTQIAHLPRLKYRNLVVLRKQTWVPKSKMPVISDPFTDERFLLEFNVWREANCIPSRCFIRVYNGSQAGQRNISNNRKPIYVDFFSPIMARLIMKLCKAEFDFYVFEEALPDINDEFSVIENKGYASELIIETNLGGTSNVAA